ncbi:MAG: hypothetical protein JRE23_02765 [Deltaproteobacteria bacterium]|nr:hypothetical protein [Deltaproteobacteria bacterium]
MSVTRIGSLENRFLGLSTDTKPTTCQIGATFREYNTGKLYDTPDGGTNWVLKDAEGIRFQTTTIDLKQAAGSYTLFTVGANNIEVLHLTIIIPADLTEESTLTSISIQSTDSTPVVFVSSTAGALANLTENKYLQYNAGGTVVGGKLIQLTIAGGATAAAQVCTVFVGYREAT